MSDNTVNLNDTELYLIMFFILFCSTGIVTYCICCTSNKKRQDYSLN